MPYDERLAARIRGLVGRRRGFVEKRMFGGVGFLLDGHMCVGVWRDSLIVRVGPAAYAAALAEPFVAEFDVTGRPMRGWIVVGSDGLGDVPSLNAWIERGVEFVETLPPKE